MFIDGSTTSCVGVNGVSLGPAGEAGGIPRRRRERRTSGCASTCRVSSPKSFWDDQEGVVPVFSSGKKVLTRSRVQNVPIFAVDYIIMDSK